VLSVTPLPDAQIDCIMETQGFDEDVESSEDIDRAFEAIMSKSSDQSVRTIIDDAPLDELFRMLETQFVAKLEEMKKAVTEKEIDNYLQLNNILLGFQHWSDDISVEKQTPLSTVEDNGSVLSFIGPAIRLQLSKAIRILEETEFMSLST
jgi:hypothetical protein